MAAGDIALRMLISATDLATVVVTNMAATYDSSLVSMSDSTLILNDYLAGLGNQAFTTGVGFDGLASSVAATEASLASVDASAATLDTSLVTVDASAASAAASTDALDAALARSAASADVTVTSNEALAASADMAAASQERAGLSAESMAHSYDTAKKAVELVGTVLVAAGVVMAGNFQQNITKLYTTAGEAKSNLQMVGDGILAMSSQVGTGSLKLSEAMYWIESGGLHGAQGLEALRVAAEAAKAENANLDKVSIALAASLNAYAGKGMTTVQVMNTLTAATGQGMMTFEQLSGSLASVLPAAAKFGISLNNVTAALATMTAQGDPAEQAATHLKQVILALEAPSKIGAKALASVGLTSTEVANELKVSLPGALQMITDAVGKKFPEGSAAYNQAIKNIAGGSKQMMGFLELTGAHMGTFSDNVKKIGSAVQAGGNDLMGWSDIQANFNFKLDQAKAAIEALLIKIGTGLLPILGRILDVVNPVIGAFTNWIGKSSAMSSTFQNISGMLGVMAGNWRDFGAIIQSTLGGPLQQFGTTMGQLLPGFLSQFLRALTLVQLAWQEVAAGVATVIGPALKVLGQIFTGAQGVIENILNALEGQFIPALHNLVTAIAPVIAGIVQWIADSGLVPAIFDGIGGAVSFLIPILSGLVNGIANVVNFFSQNQAAALALMIPLGALGGYFVFLGVSAVASFIAAAPAMIAGFIAGAAAAWTMAAGVIAATWPFLLIGAAIGLVIFIIVLLVQHWGQVVSFLSRVWGGFSSWFMGILGSIGNFFKGVWNGITSFFQAAVAWIVNAAQVGFQLLLHAIFGPIYAIVDGFSWLYNHNYYFKDLVDAIVNFFKGCFTWLTDQWNKFTGWIAGIWKGISDKASEIWGNITGTVGSKTKDTTNALQGAWNTAGSWLGDKWKSFVQLNVDTWNAVSGVAKVLWTQYLQPPLQAAWNGLLTFINGWPKDALQAGINFISMLVQGITSGAGAIWNAVTGIAQNIWKALGFHSPTEAGPGADADRWMPNLINMLVGGLNAGVPAMHRAALNVAAPLAQIGGGSGNSFGLSGAGGNAFALSGSNGNAFALGNGGQTIIVQVQPATANITMDHRKVGEGVMNYASREVRLQGAIRNR